jgi:hypothetical protein
VETFSEWEPRFIATLQPLLAALNQCEATYERKWEPALLSHADQLGAASGTLRKWSAEHPCPSPGVDVQLARIWVAFAHAGASFESMAEGRSSVTWLVVHHELRNMRKVVTKLFRMLEEKAGQPF